MVAQIADDLYEVQVVSWYDNENSYTSQMVRTIKSVSYTHLDVYKRQDAAGDRGTAGRWNPAGRNPASGCTFETVSGI